MPVLWLARDPLGGHVQPPALQHSPVWRRRGARGSARTEPGDAQSTGQRTRRGGKREPSVLCEAVCSCRLSCNLQVQHIHFLSDHIGALYLNDEYSDVTLVVDGQRFDAHKVILAARSEYFRALLFGGMRESGLDEIELKDTPLAAFKYLLRYIYTGQMSLGSLKDELVLEILGLAHQYGFQDLEAAVSNHLRAVLSIRNVCLIYDTAALYQLRDLVSSCCLFMDRHAAEIIKHDSFLNMSANGVRDVVSRDSFCAPEVEIFRSVHDWVRANPSEERAPILRSVRLSLMATPDLLKVVRPTGLVPPDVMLDAIQSRTESRDMELKYRGYLSEYRGFFVLKFLPN